MTFRYDWNNEVIAKFYTTLWMSRGVKEWFYFAVDGTWYRCSKGRFACTIGLHDSDLLKPSVHNYNLPHNDDVVDLHLDGASFGSF